MISYLTLIANNPSAIRLPKVNHENDLETCMDYCNPSSITDIKGKARLYSLFSFCENDVRKALNRLVFAPFSGEHALTLNLLPFRFYSKDGLASGKEARLFIKDFGLIDCDESYALFQEIKADHSNETIVFVHAAVCGALLHPSRSLCDELHGLAQNLAERYVTLDIELYNLSTMLRADFGDAWLCRRGSWPLDQDSKVKQSSPLKAMVLETTRRRVS